MSRFFVERVKCGVADSGMPGGDVIVTIQYRKDDGPSQWISNAECDGYATIYLNDFDPFDVLMSEDDENEKRGVGMIDSFENIEFNDYEDMFDAFSEDEDNPVVPLLRYLIAVTRCGKDEQDKLIAAAQGKYIDEVEVPISDIEEDYLDDLEEE